MGNQTQESRRRAIFSSKMLRLNICLHPGRFPFANHAPVDSHLAVNDDIASVPGAASPPSAPPPNRIRWWPTLVIVVATLLGVLWACFVEDTHRQGRNLHTVCICLAALLLLLLWCVCGSRLRWRIRLIVLAAVIATVAAAAFAVKIRGVTGDLVPILEWRWQEDESRQPQPEKAVPPISAWPTQQHTIGGVPDGYPQFLGPNRNATLPGPALARDWTAQPPQQVWRQPIRPGWSGFAVAQGFAVTQEQNGAEEMVTCYEALAGRVIWSHANPARYCTTLAGEGPRATPTIAGNRVYAVGATGILNCLDLRTGALMWSKNVVRENGSRVPVWGLSVSPLIVDNTVVVSVGGGAGRSLVAYDRETGRFVWGGGHDATGYSSPVICELAGVRQIVMFNASSVAGHDASSGKLLWEYPWPDSHPHVAAPVILPDDRVLVSIGYGVGSQAFQVRRPADNQWTASRAWKSLRLKAKFTNVVCHEGYLYGLDDGTMVCLDAATGEQKWKGARYGHGQEILVGKLLLVTAENGDVVLLEPVPQEPRELTRFAAFKTKTWNPPALAGEFLFLRNDLEAACFRLPVEE